MSFLKQVTITAIFLFLSSFAHAWDLKDFKEEAASPWTTDAKYTLIAGTAITTTLLIFEDQISDPFQKTQVRHKPLGSSSKYGDYLGQLIPNILYVGGMGLAGYYNKNPLAYDRAIGMFKATAYSSAVTTIIKYTAREPRPYDHNVKNSFPSGHATTAFAFSGFVAAEHGWAWGAPALVMSTFVAYSRINDNKHWLHDVVAGGTIGWVYGWGIAKLNHGKKKKEGEVSVVPIYDSKTAGLSLYREF